eukprot:CAMPEP_0116543082 /NCGR_PEP_ID=MMETSP0397-20121206/1366_1 /TAXON_ID=216820 /ORGANISM="Cyclophora tenuis, Strain ECT3854" /LENGTH=50 /DNA_ID=CAMNT_0004067147 /DNA_START=64 /DNA_END=213 /DNA_ORIENTATION=+
MDSLGDLMDIEILPDFGKGHDFGDESRMGRWGQRMGGWVGRQFRQPIVKW